jgi:hypothetical protein
VSTSRPRSPSPTHLHAWQPWHADSEGVPLVRREPEVLVESCGHDAVAGAAAAGTGGDAAAHRLDRNALRLLCAVRAAGMPQAAVMSRRSVRMRSRAGAEAGVEWKAPSSSAGSYSRACGAVARACA